MITSRTHSVARALAAFAVSLSTLVLAPTGVAHESGRERAQAHTTRATAVPILMYHVIGNPRAGAAYPDLFVRPADFASQMRWLDRHGYQAVTLRAVWKHWHRGAPLPTKPVVVSFDDGYRSIAQAAFRSLNARGWAGVLNLTVKNLRVAGGLSDRQVRRLIAAGWELDSHTLTHPNLPSLGARELQREVAGSRTALRQKFGVPVDFFCYPAGRYDARVIAAVRRAGYLGATTTIDGLATPGRPYELRRVRVGRGDGVSGLAAVLLALRS
jgi:peptidoglycan/xylan/chitin deacetylase (PgdA/CDA1 family)